MSEEAQDAEHSPTWREHSSSGRKYSSARREHSSSGRKYSPALCELSSGSAVPPPPPFDRGVVVQMFFYPANSEGPRVDVSCPTIGDEAADGGEECLCLEECSRRVRVLAP